MHRKANTETSQTGDDGDEREIIELRHDGRKSKSNVGVVYKELPLDDELVDFDDEELCPGRRRGTSARQRSLDDDDFSQSDFKH